MKKSVFTLAVLLSFIALMFSSCEKAIPDPTKEPEQYGGTYKVYLDNKIVGEGSTEEVGLMADLVTMADGNNFSVIVAEVPVEVGEIADLNDALDEAGVIIGGIGLKYTADSEEYYFSTSGQIKRDSKTKISFEGYCVYGMNLDSLSFKGVLESEAFKLIKEEVY